MGGCTSLLEDEQIVLKDINSCKKTVVNGPSGFTCTGMQDVVDRRKSVVLNELQYARVLDNLSGTKKHINGPIVMWLGAYETLVEKSEITVLGTAQYCIVKDVESGEQRSVFGPERVLFSNAHEKIPAGVQNCKVLKQGQYCKIKDAKTGKHTIYCGPRVLQLTPYETIIGDTSPLPILEHGEYCKIKDQVTGTVRIVTGPRLVELLPNDQVVVACAKLPILKQGEYCKIIDEKEGNVRMVYGPAFVKLSPTEEIHKGVMKCPDLSASEYIVVRNESEGTERNVVGPILFMPSAFDVFDEIREMIVLEHNEYVKICDCNGRLRTERGPKRVIPDPLDEVLDGGKKCAAVVDEHHAVLVRDASTASLHLVDTHGLFFPKPYEQIIEVREKIVLEQYVTVVCKDHTGRFYYASGDMTLPEEQRGPGPAFFLPPHHELVTASWSTDLRMEHTTYEEVSRFDSRPRYMNYEFECRTLDNVSLLVDVTFFWRIIDVRSMVEATKDAPGDTCTHARSMIMSEISRLTLMEFLSCFNETIRNACLSDKFYTERGVELLSVEVLRFSCTSQETDRVLQEIIKETCDRLKHKERQKGENEVTLERLEGEIEEEKVKRELIEVKKSHLKIEAKIEGEAKGIEISEFINRIATTDLNGSQIGVAHAVKIYETQCRHKFQRDSLKAIIGGNASITVMPSTANLNVGNPFVGNTRAIGGVHAPF
eukprot:TRINITY_DN5891_c0_g1_i1.p1 TRINITY_DN5891_c0_g1~~TRINITY_DN5891_c0_g1_i1.p1  ORF type:complete len:711 (+),score=260.75 TRINITY_DN5891_c0_g1_i1:76-2208(+)